MNNDLISRAAAIEAIERREPLMVGDKLVSTDSFKNFLRNRPAVDAEPVRHGRWLEPYPNDIWDCYECSNCGTKYERMWRYCPNCGTKMDGDRL